MNLAVFQYLACLLAIGLLPKGVSLFLAANYLGERYSLSMK